MTKIEQMDELVQKAQEDAALQQKFAEILLAEEPEETAEADKWLVSLGYQFNLEELQEHMEDGIPLAEDQLDAVAGGAVNREEMMQKSLELEQRRPQMAFICALNMRNF